MSTDHNKDVNSAHEIMPGLWLGNQSASQDQKFLQDIDVVVNATKHIPFAPGDRIKIRVAVNDPGPIRVIDRLTNDQEIMIRELPNVVNQIWGHRKAGRSVLIHCHAGAQRSAAIMAAYLVQYGVWTSSKLPKRNLTIMKLNSAIDLLIKKRPVAFFGGRSVNFKPALLAHFRLL